MGEMGLEIGIRRRQQYSSCGLMSYEDICTTADPSLYLSGYRAIGSGCNREERRSAAMPMSITFKAGWPEPMREWPWFRIMHMGLLGVENHVLQGMAGQGSVHGVNM